jgi:enamine deaminase RidA (YjgF/YER057c/UK114 family)
MATTPTERLRELGLALPPPPRPIGSYTAAVVESGLAFVSGQIVTKDGAAVLPGRVDREVPVERAQELARLATLQALSALADRLGTLDRVRRVLRVVVYVASSDGFVRQHQVGNGATDVLVEIFGEAGRPARAAVGVTALPLNAPVEIELLVAVA